MVALDSTHAAATVDQHKLEVAIAELAEAVRPLLEPPLPAAAPSEAAKRSGQVTALSREVLRLAQQAREIAPPALAGDVGAEEADDAMGMAAVVASAARPAPPQAASAVRAVTEEADEAIEVALEPAQAAADGCPEREEDSASSESREGSPERTRSRFVAKRACPAGEVGAAAAEVPQRTQSQFVKRLKVDDVAKKVSQSRRPVQQLRRALSQLEKHPAPSEHAEASEELHQVQKLHQSLRNFGEDLMEGMLALDQISGLAEQDRQVRKETLRGIQDLLDEIDSAKPRIAGLQKRLAAEVEALETNSAESEEDEPPVGGPENAPSGEQSRPPFVRPSLDWRRLRLPIDFTSSEQPRAYLLSAQLAGLDADSLELERLSGGVLAVRGARLPTAAEEEALLQSVAEQLQRLPPAARALLSQADVDELALRLGRGRFGAIEEEFRLPRDVDWDAIRASRQDDLLRVVLPRRSPAGPHSFGALGYPGGVLGGPAGFMW